jgi:hypothetical protein
MSGQITSMQELCIWLDAGHSVYTIGVDRAKHPSFFMSMPYRTVRNLIRNNKVFKAIRIRS